MTETRAPGDAPPPASQPPAAGGPGRAPAGKVRDTRLAAALRANLARRKAQGRARAADARPPADPADDSQEE